MSEPPKGLPESGPVPRPPDDAEILRSFPKLEVSPGVCVWRVHTTDRKPWYFSEAGRFGLTSPAGTCYVAQDPMTSICERVIKGRICLLPEDLEGKSIREMPMPKLFVLADSPQAVRFGIGRSFSTEEPYDRCREWALALHSVGFAGVAYWPSHDPRRGDRLSYALFDREGERSSWRVGGRPSPLDSADWLRKIKEELGINIVGPPDDPELPFTEDL
jgi:hypothetical protein